MVYWFTVTTPAVKKPANEKPPAAVSPDTRPVMERLTDAIVLHLKKNLLPPARRLPPIALKDHPRIKKHLLPKRLHPIHPTPAPTLTPAHHLTMMNWTL